MTSQNRDGEKDVPLVSVVTPFYNTAEFLRECIESVLAQSYREFEYIIFDNASNDGSSEIAREYATRDSRIKLHRSDELLAQVKNYNRALEKVSPAAKYIKIVQADDWIYPSCIESMVLLAERNPRVGLVSSYLIEGMWVKGHGLPYDTSVVPGRVMGQRHLREPIFMFGTPTTVMYRADAVRNRQPFFSVNRYHEDTEACYEILAEWDFGFVHQILSYLREAPNSLMGRVRQNDSGALDVMIVLERYGTTFLDQASIKECRETRKRAYYRFLGRQAIQFRKREFWEYHRRGLASVGLRLSAAELAWAVGIEIAEIVLNPLMTVRDIMRRVGNGRPGRES